MMFTEKDLTGKGYGEEELLFYSGSAEMDSEHPLALSIIEEANQKGLSLVTPEGFNAIPGKGIITNIEGKKVIIGNKKIMVDNNIDLTKYSEKYVEFQNLGITTILVSIDNQIRGLLGISDKIKEQAPYALEKLRNMGLATYMLTGDNKQTAQIIGKQLGFDNEHILAEVLRGGRSVVGGL